MKDIVKLNPSVTIVVAQHTTPSGVSMGTLIIRVSDIQDLFQDLLLPAMDVPELGSHLFLGETVAQKGVNLVTAKESYFDVGQFKIPL